jgi:hypothetical protein
MPISDPLDDRVIMGVGQGMKPFQDILHLGTRITLNL